METKGFIQKVAQVRNVFGIILLSALWIKSYRKVHITSFVHDIGIE